MYLKPIGKPLQTNMVPPPTQGDGNPYLRTTLPQSQQLQTDLAKQHYTTSIPQIRISPPAVGSSAAFGAAIASALIKTTTPVTPPTPASGQLWEVNGNGHFEPVTEVNGIPV